MNDLKHTMSDLYQMQSLSLDSKVRMTASRIKAWVKEFGEEGCYISFSGGKDSTVLLDIVRNVCGYEQMKAMFVDVPTQYPELKKFVLTFNNVDIVKPKISFVQVCEKYGFPLVSKEVSENVEGARKYLTVLEKELNIGQSENFRTEILTKKSNELASMLNEKMINKSGGNNQRLAIMLGWLTKDKNEPIKANIPENDRSNFALTKWKFLLDSPFEISNKCCNVMKKNPAHEYYKQTGRKPITAQMAAESRLRLQKWLQNGCNGFNLRIPTSNPMAFWTEQDVLLYIKQNNLPICSVYGDIVIDYEKMGELDGQSFLFETGTEPLKTTGCERTGCVLCGFGCHLEKEGEGRFEMLKQTHPKFYGLLDVCKNNGMTYREAIEWLNVNGGLNIRL